MGVVQCFYNQNAEREWARLAQKPTAWQNWMQIVLATCKDPTILGGSEHTLCVGRRGKS